MFCCLHTLLMHGEISQDASVTDFGPQTWRRQKNGGDNTFGYVLCELGCVGDRDLRCLGLYHFVNFENGSDGASRRAGRNRILLAKCEGLHQKVSEHQVNSRTYTSSGINLG